MRTLSNPLRNAFAVSIATVSTLTGTSNAQLCLSWGKVFPSERANVGLAYDSARDVLVKFGGLIKYEQFSETWEWDGSSWILRTTMGPSPRQAYCMAFDSKRNVTVLFGGFDGERPTKWLNDTWEWDGSRWIERMSKNTPPDQSGTMTYDSKRNVMVLYSVGETWEWNGYQWYLRSIDGPNTGFGSYIAFDTERSVSVLIANDIKSGTVETWEWEGNTWSLKATGEPPTRYLSDMTYDPIRRVMVLFGGLGSNKTLDDTWSWDGKTWSLVSTAGPGKRTYHSMAFFGKTKEILLFGGSGYGQLRGDMWSWDGTSWRLLYELPRSRYAASLTFDPIHNLTVMFGGKKAHEIEPLGDTWGCNGTIWTQLATSGPSARSGHVTVFDNNRGVHVLFGGSRYTSLLGDTWELNGTEWSLRSSTGPAARSCHAMAFDSNRNVTVLFGGTLDWRGTTLSGETWEWNGINWSLRSTDGPTPRKCHDMVYDKSRNVTVLVGGFAEHPILYSDTWEWNGVTWVEKKVLGPTPQKDFSMAYDSTRETVILYSPDSKSNEPTPETWEWDGDSWTKLSQGGPSAGVARIAYDSNRNVHVRFGGQTLDDLSDTWEFSIESTCSGDLTCDGIVNVDDLIDLIGAWGPCPPFDLCIADLTSDNVVNVFDMLQLLDGWYSCI